MPRPKARRFWIALILTHCGWSKACWNPALAESKPGDRVQFERLGYFCKDKDSTASLPVFNRTATLRDTWAKLEKKGA